MTQMSAAATTVERVLKPIQQFTRGWMMAPETLAYGEQVLGLTRPRQFQIVGRAGVLGSCPAEVAVGALAFHGDAAVFEAWNNLPDGIDHRTISEHYASRITDWGERVISTFDDDRMERLDRYGRRILDAAPACLGSIFAGWRAMSIPAELGGRVAMTTHVLREMRGAAHVNAIVCAGLTPVDAMIASTNVPPRTGPEYAERMGFAPPFRDVEEVRESRLEAERITSRIVEQFFRALDDDELADFGELVETTRNAIDM